MKILITSDIHGQIDKIDKIKESYILHLDAGDSMLKESLLHKESIYSVRGNCDTSLFPLERIYELESHKILIVHGHQFGVKQGLHRLIDYAKKKEITLCIYGHTHIQKIDEIEGILFVNPGAIMNKGLEYALYENGKIHLKKVEL